ncbi:MAG TPA: chitobiase/beta-hexosaminidase C-terminal domain-containing protein, partial [Thermomicrobiales bacterium]|nr:chitobiase/beta-hexosaminidase C-terminal domain-containing protein [Thermomicrobiales bacterium]
TRAAAPAAPPLAPLPVQAAPGSGVYPEPQTVTLTAAPSSAIFYTADGSDPTTSPTRARYRGPLPIAGTTLLKVVAIAPDNQRSSVLSAVYTIATTAGYRDQAYAGASAPTAKEEASELWHHADAWWGVLYHPTAPKGLRIARLDPATQLWRDVGAPTLDPRPSAKFDVLADGDMLYLAAHLMQGPNQEDVSGRRTDPGAVQFQRLRFDAARQTYRADLPPRPIAAGTMETFVLAKDTTGTLWGAFTQDNVVKVMHTQGADANWTAPYQLPTAGSAVSSDDTAALVAFGAKIGVMWSNQCPDHQGCPPNAQEHKMYFAWHADGAADAAWTGEVAYFVAGKKGADDHINLKADASGRVYAAVKTSFTQPADPLINLLVRQADGTWDAYPVGTVADDQTRAIVLLDASDDAVFVFAAAPARGGAIYVKQSSLSAIAFAPGRGTPIIQSAADATINNVTSTKQTVDRRSGLVVLAGDDGTHRYLHNTLALPRSLAAGPAAAATATAAAEQAGCADGPLYPVGADVVTTRPAPLSAVAPGLDVPPGTPGPVALAPAGTRLAIAGPYVEAGVCDRWPVQRPGDPGIWLIDERNLQAIPPP